MLDLIFIKRGCIVSDDGLTILQKVAWLDLHPSWNSSLPILAFLAFKELSLPLKMIMPKTCRKAYASNGAMRTDYDDDDDDNDAEVTEWLAVGL